MNYELLRQKIVESHLGKEEVAKRAGYKTFKNLARAIDDRKSMKIAKLEILCNILEIHPSTFLEFSPDHKKK